MPLTRRGFLQGLGAGSAGLALRPALGARGLEESSAFGGVARFTRLTGPIQLDRNENPNGPGRHVLEAIRASFGDASRYPDDPEEELRKAIATAHGVTPDWVLMGCGSTEILRVAVMAFCGPGRPLVTAAPTFEEPVRMATALKVPVVEVAVDRAMRLDLEGMSRAAPSAGLVFVCNPNNPTATVHGAAAIRDFLSRTHSASPETTVLVDEAYHDFVEDPSYATAIPLVKDDPRVVLSRTFSKVYGLAGFRVGYAIARPETIATMRPWRVGNGINLAAAVGAVAAMGNPAHIKEELRLSREARAFTRSFFEGLGYRVEPSETNFVMVDIRRDSKQFKDTCLTRGVMIGRQFPQFKQHTRISIGSIPEMEKATTIFRAVLATS